MSNADNQESIYKSSDEQEERSYLGVAIILLGWFIIVTAGFTVDVLREHIREEQEKSIEAEANQAKSESSTCTELSSGKGDTPLKSCDNE
jgi:hypothetical protein